MEIDEQVVELQHKVYHNEMMEKERAISDERYAVKLVERIVFGFCAIILVAVVGAIVALVVI